MITPLHLTRSVRSLNRLRLIAQVLTQHGFGHVVEQMNLARFVPVWMMRKKKGQPPEDSGSALGRRLARVCTDLGPTFVKLGQMLTTRPDILPASVIRELRVLQDDVPPFDTSVARQIIADELGQRIGECFASFDETPIASGSIGQVYRAEIRGGAPVVVKVRRPDIDQVITQDMQLLKWLAESLENLVPELRIYRPMMIVLEFEQMLAREMDYINEASSTARLADAFTSDSAIRIPRVHWELCGPRVLTLGALAGSNIETLLAREEGAETVLDRPLLARRLADAYLHQVFDIGLFHADPHPGNILVEPPATIGLIDFGQVGTISDETMTQLVIMIYAATHKDVGLVVDTMADMGALGPQTNRRDLQRVLRGLLDKYYGLPLKRFDITTLVSEFSDVVRQHDVAMPREMVVLVKALGMVSGMATRLDPELDMLELLKPRLKQTMLDRLSPARLARSAAVSGWHLLSMLRHAPINLREAARRLASGSWQLNVKHENIDRLSNELDRSSNRLAFSVVIAAIIVGSSIVISADSKLAIFGVEVQSFGLIGYLVAGILGLALSWAIFRSGRLH